MSVFLLHEEVTPRHPTGRREQIQLSYKLPGRLGKFEVLIPKYGYCHTPGTMLSSPWRFPHFISTSRSRS